MSRIKVTKEWIYQKYVKDGWTDERMAAEFNISAPAIRRHRKKHGIQAFTQDERRQGLGKKSLKELTAEVFRKLYFEEKKTFQEIGDLYGVQKPAILKLAKEYKVEVLKKYQRRGGDTLTDLQRDVIVGGLLGDGCIPYQGIGESSNYKVSHSHRQYTYLLKTAAELGTLAKRVTPSVTTSKTGKTRVGYTVATYYNSEIRKLRHLFYRDDMREKVPSVTWLKAPPREVFRTLSWRALAYWYFDDGTFLESSTSPSIVIYFPLLSIEEIKEDLISCTSLNWYWKNGAQDHLYHLRLPAKDGREFFRKIVKFATPDLTYKFPKACQQDISGEVQFSSVLSIQEAARLEHYSVPAWKRLDRETQQQWIDEVFQIYRSTGFPFGSAQEDDTVIRTLKTLQKYSESLEDLHVFNKPSGALSLCNTYMPHRLQARVQGESAWDVFMDDARFRKVIRKQFESPSAKKVEQKAMLSALSAYGGVRAPSNFRPGIAKAIVDGLCPEGGVCWDPCAGFGGRLVGAVCSFSNVRYIATEPSPQTVNALKKLWKRIYTLMDWDPARVEILKGVAEKDCPNRESVDLVFTSPPYYNAEEYLGGRQSFQHGGYETWVDSFLHPLVQNSHNSLKEGGYMAINIQNVNRGGVTYDLVGKLDELALGVGFSRNRRWWRPLSRHGPQRSDEPILVYKKTSEDLGIEWDLGEVHVTNSKNLDDFDRTCKKCGKSLMDKTVKAQYCDDCSSIVDADRARENRRLHRIENPIREYREAKCKRCSEVMRLPLTGGVPNNCKKCVDEIELESRTKKCAYRHCGREFEDDTPNKIVKYCHKEHARRESQLHKGRVKSVSDFLKPDPVLEAGKVVVKTKNCLLCRDPFVPEAKESRCKPCREALRQKECKKCGAGFEDRSAKNTRKHCDACQV